MLAQDRKILIEHINLAFDDVPKPSFFGNKELKNVRWQDMSPNRLRILFADELHGLSSEQFRYFLPAILIGIILDPKKCDVLTDQIIDQLALPEEGTRHRIAFDQRIVILNDKMKCAIKRFILSYKKLEPYGAWTLVEYDRHKLEQAIEFWSQI